ncbi:MAG: hypothetical protein HY665_05105 [Chloroflexi bacterium]|nr:hypothetical protein [Chloroflexota bacterium]
MKAKTYKAYFLFTGTGPLVIITSYDSINNPALLEKLAGKGLTKFIAHEIPMKLAKEKYGMHFDVVCGDLRQSDDLRVLDYSGDRAFKLFNFKELGPPIYHEPSNKSA